MPTAVLGRTDAGSAPPDVDNPGDWGDGDGCRGCFGGGLLLLLLVPGVVLFFMVLSPWLLVRAVGRAAWRLGLGRHAQGLQVGGVLRPAIADAGGTPLLSDLLPLDRVRVPLHAPTVDEVIEELVERVEPEIPQLTLVQIPLYGGLDLAADGVVVLTAKANPPRMATCRTVEPLEVIGPKSGRKEPGVRLFFLVVAKDVRLYSDPLSALFRSAGPRLLAARDADEFRQVVVECQEEFEQRMAQERVDRAKTRVGCWVVAVAVVLMALSYVVMA
jgi:hypothetical protein